MKEWTGDDFNHIYPQINVVINWKRLITFAADLKENSYVRN